MATLTIADLDNGKRDLQTVDAVANSREDFTQSRYGESVLTLAGALRRLGYQAPVPYASGLNVTTGLFTVERDGVVYAPVTYRVPFTTGDWDESQWRVVQNTNDDRRAFIFQTKTEADIAAATLPEGQFVDALDVQQRYKVQGGVLVFDSELLGYFDNPLKPGGPGLGALKLGHGALARSSVDLTSDSIAIGRDAQGSTRWSRMNMAIGANSMSKGDIGSANIALGAWTLTHLSGGSSSVSALSASRNVAIGALAGHFVTTGNRLILIGRNAGQTLTTGQQSVAVGYRSGSCGSAPVGLTGEITNQTPTSSSYNVAVGDMAGEVIKGNYNALLGYGAGLNWRSSSGNTVIGAGAAGEVDSGLSFNNIPLVAPQSTTATYSQTGDVITVTCPAHGGSAGKFCHISFNSGAIYEVTGETQFLQIDSVLDADKFTIKSPVNLEASGSATLVNVEAGDPTFSGTGNTIIGRSACSGSKQIGSSNVVIGISCGASMSKSAEYNAFVGANTARYFSSGFNNTFFGRQAGQLNIDGSNLTTVSGSTLLGANSRCSGSNQVQLGSSGTTTYAYGAVQDRSDERDKADVRDTVLGLDFINDLRPVDFKWDMRDDYVQTKEDGTVEILPKDGSKKRGRYHHGVIAQELRAVMEKHGVDFGGFQDHSVNGGCDVLSVGYTELIAPLIKAVQELSARVKELEER